MRPDCEPTTHSRAEHRPTLVILVSEVVSIEELPSSKDFKFNSSEVCFERRLFLDSSLIVHLTTNVEEEEEATASGAEKEARSSSFLSAS